MLFFLFDFILINFWRNKIIGIKKNLSNLRYINCKVKNLRIKRIRNSNKK